MSAGPAVRRNPGDPHGLRAVVVQGLAKGVDPEAVARGDTMTIDQITVLVYGIAGLGLVAWLAWKEWGEK
jgi:hypothetical protein